MKIASGQEEPFREGIRSYVEVTNAAPGCLRYEEPWSLEAQVLYNLEKALNLRGCFNFADVEGGGGGA